MDRIENKVYSHLSINRKYKDDNRQVAADKGYIINNYRELFDAVSRISYENPKFHLLFRGQDSDPRVIKKGRYGRRSSIYPSIYRMDEGKRFTRIVRKNRFEEMRNKCQSMIINYPFTGITRIKKFEEIQWAIIQHYQISRTPLIDMTDSLQVASTFATRNNKNEFGYVFVFGIPYSNGSISYHVDDGIVVVRLASACPPDALRAHYQHAYFVGSFPHDEERRISKNAANLMIAKFRIRKPRFWNRTFQRIPESILFPKQDNMDSYLNSEIN